MIDDATIELKGQEETTIAYAKDRMYYPEGSSVIIFQKTADIPLYINVTK